MGTRESQRICLVSLNARKSHSNLALLNLQAMLGQNPEDTEIIFLDHTINSDPALVLRDIYRTKARVILFSVYIWNKLQTQNMIHNIKKLSPECCVIIGGPEAEFNSEWWKNNSLADHLLQGPIEAWGNDLLHLQASSKGLQIHPARSYPICNLPFPYSDSILKSLEGRLAYYEASRGCQFRCSYCVSAISKKKVEYQNIEKVLSELKVLAFSKVKVIKMVDRTFNYNREFAHTIWQTYIDWNPPVPIHFEIHPALLTEECFTILKKAPHNLFQLEIGIQSTNKECLKNIHRFDKWETTKKNIQRLGQMKNLHLHVDQIVGLPGSSIETEIQSFNDIIGIGAGEFQLGFLKILPGTPLAERLEEFGIIHSAEPPYQILQTASLPYEQLERLRDIEFVLGQLYNSGKFNYSIEYLLSINKSAFHIFDGICSYARKLIDEKTKRWEEWASVILSYTEDNVDSREKKTALQDYVRIDWGSQAKSQFFPPVLSKGIEQHWQKEKSGIKSQVCDNTLTAPDFKRSLYIRLESDTVQKRFKAKHLMLLHPDRTIHTLADT